MTPLAFVGPIIYAQGLPAIFTIGMNLMDDFQFSPKRKTKNWTISKTSVLKSSS